MKAALDGDKAFGALTILDYLQDLFTVAGRDEFKRDEILVVLNATKHSPEIFDADIVAAYDLAIQSLEGQQ